MTTEKLFTQINDEVIELTGDALDELLTLRAELAAEEEARQTALAEAKVKREALLERLGITEEEAGLLLG